MINTTNLLNKTGYLKAGEYILENAPSTPLLAYIEKNGQKRKCVTQIVEQGVAKVGTGSGKLVTEGSTLDGSGYQNSKEKVENYTQIYRDFTVISGSADAIDEGLLEDEVKGMILNAQLEWEKSALTGTKTQEGGVKKMAGLLEQVPAANKIEISLTEFNADPTTVFKKALFKSKSNTLNMALCGADAELLLDKLAVNKTSSANDKLVFLGGKEIQTAKGKITPIFSQVLEDAGKSNAILILDANKVFRHYLGADRDFVVKGYNPEGLDGTGFQILDESTALSADPSGMLLIEFV